jgi:hypothetical protein
LFFLLMLVIGVVRLLVNINETPDHSTNSIVIKTGIGTNTILAVTTMPSRVVEVLALPRPLNSYSLLRSKRQTLSHLLHRQLVVRSHLRLQPQWLELHHYLPLKSSLMRLRVEFRQGFHAISFF